MYLPTITPSCGPAGSLSCYGLRLQFQLVWKLSLINLLGLCHFLLTLEHLFYFKTPTQYSYCLMLSPVGSSRFPIMKLFPSLFPPCPPRLELKYARVDTPPVAPFHRKTRGEKGERDQRWVLGSIKICMERIFSAGPFLNSRVFVITPAGVVNAPQCNFSIIFGKGSHCISFFQHPKSF